MRKETIIIVLVLLVVAGAFGAVYQFYFRVKLTEYGERMAYAKELEQKISEYEGTFHRTKPEIVVAEWRKQVRPLSEALERRLTYFNMDGMVEYEPVPENRIPKFHYEQQFDRLYQEMQAYAWQHTPPVYVAESIVFSAPNPDQITTAKADEVHEWLEAISFGASVVRMLVDSGAVSILDLAVWEPRVAGEYGRLIEVQTIGVMMQITAEDLVRWIDEKRREERYFTFDAIQVQNRSLRAPNDPLLDVQVLFSLARPAPEGAGATELADGRPGGDARSMLEMFGMGPRFGQDGAAGEPRRRSAPPWYQRAWRWFKRNILYMN